MAPNDSDRKSGDAARREAERQAVRNARLTEALRANLRRRKAQVRGRETAADDGEAIRREPEPPND